MHHPHPQHQSQERFEDEIDLGRYVRPLLRSWKLLVAGGVIGAVIGIGVAMRRPTLYEASTTLLVLQAGSGAAFSTSRALLRNHTLASQTIAETGLDKDPYRMTPQTFVNTVLTVEEVPGTMLLRVKTRLSDPNLAARASNVLSAKAVDLNRKVATEGNTTIRNQLKVLLDDASQRLKAAEQELLTRRSAARVEVLKKDAEVMLEGRGELRDLLIDIEVEKSRLAAAEKEIAKHQPLLVAGRSVDAEAALRRAGRDESVPAPQTNAGRGATPPAEPANPANPDFLDLTNPYVNPVYQTLAFQIATSRTRLAGMERELAARGGGRSLESGRPGPLTDLYRGEIEIERLQNQYDLAKRVYSDLSVRYEQSRTDTVGSMVQLQVVDDAFPPDAPMPRKRAESALLGLTAGALLAALLALALNREGAGGTAATAPKSRA